MKYLNLELQHNWSAKLLICKSSIIHMLQDCSFILESIFLKKKKVTWHNMDYMPYIKVIFSVEFRKQEEE